MTIFQRIGLLSKRAKPVGKNLEKGDVEGSASRRNNIAIKIGIFGTLLLVTLAVFPIGQVYKLTVQVDGVWQDENLLAPFLFPIEKSAEELATERAQIRLTEPAIFRRDTGNVSRMREEGDSITVALETVFAVYASFKENLSRGRLESASRDSIAFIQSRNASGILLSPGQWERLLGSYSSTVPGLASPTRTISPQRLDEQLLAEAYNTAIQILRTDVIDVPLDSVLSDRITIRDEIQFAQSDIPKAFVLGTDDAYKMAGTAFQNRHPSETDESAIAMVFFATIFQPSLRFDRMGTEERWLNRERASSPTQSVVRQNEVIVRKGDRITPEIQRKLISLERERNERAGVSLSGRRFFGQLILVLATYLVFFLYLFILRRPIFDDNRLIFLIALLFLGILAFYGVAMRAALINMYVVPVVAVAIMFTVIFDSRVALFATMTLALIGAHLLSYDLSFFFATLFAGTLGIFSVRDIRNRSQFFLSAGLVFLGYVSVFFAGYLLQNMAFGRFTDQVIFAGMSSSLVLLAYPMLWVFERVFDLTTDLTLLELSDTNRPLLKELSMKAPGTFNHVLQVANLAEAAATAVGANALLTRVGALYHDVGKMSKPEYFVENQRGSSNPHDQLKPRMSALIISNHVKEGLEIAKDYGIPQRVQDFIPMHHGTSRIEFFYQKALERQKLEGTTVHEAEFRYPGPKPNTAETSILMLADCVEAAARAQENPNHKRLESLINAMVADRMQDGQLNDSGLTFADLNKIKETFLTVLMGIYHIRVKYPGDEVETSSYTSDEAQVITEKSHGQGENGAESQEAESSGDQLPQAID